MKIHLYVTKPGKKWYQCSTYISCHGKSTTQSRITVQLAVHCTGSTAQMMVMACQRQLSQQLVRTYSSTNELHIQSAQAYLVTSSNTKIFKFLQYISVFCTTSMLEKVSRIHKTYLLNQQLFCWRHFSKTEVMQNTDLNIFTLAKMEINIWHPWQLKKSKSGSHLLCGDIQGKF